MTTSIDYGYPWWLSYGHAPILLAAGLIAAAAYARGWPRWVFAVSAACALWSGAAMVVTRFVIDVNGRPTLPTEAFLKLGSGRVLDIGAGTGRSSVMVLTSRPGTTLVALDRFGESFEQHFGHGETPQQRLLANLKAAGVGERATIATADMRELPFEAASFDAVVSAYAMDHVNRQGSDRAIAEAARVLKAGGEFLLMVVASEKWTKFAFGPLLGHTTRPTSWWSTHVRDAGFQVVEEGTRPLTFYVLARRL